MNLGSQQILITNKIKGNRYVAKCDGQSKDKLVESECQHAENNKRTLRVAGNVVFIQNKCIPHNAFMRFAVRRLFTPGPKTFDDVFFPDHSRGRTVSRIFA